MDRLTPDQKELLKIRLTCLNISGLHPDIAALAGSTLVQYSGSLVGRDFRIISQAAIFALYDLLDSNIVRAWSALCTLVPVIWEREIEDLDDYLVGYVCSLDCAGNVC
jgi:hypothetical protein